MAVDSRKQYDFYLSEKARLQFMDILHYQGLHFSAQRADKIKESLLKAFHDIRKNPLAYQVETSAEVIDEGIRRKIVHAQYRVIYRIEGKLITVLSIVHTSRSVGRN